MLFVSIKGKLNFLQLGRYSAHPESLFRYHFEKSFDFMDFNSNLISNNSSGRKAIAFDPSYLNKSGKHTPGVGYFWSGVASKAKWGLEICGLAVLDAALHTAFHLHAFQTIGLKEEQSLLAFYAQEILSLKDKLQPISTYLCADAYFSKQGFADVLSSAGFVIISRLRDDADLRYIFDGQRTKSKGRPKQYDGKIDYQLIQDKHLPKVSTMKEEIIRTGIVYSKSLKMNIRLVMVCTPNKKGKWSHKLYFSTHTDQDWQEVLEFYRLRFQIEFLYRDAKQYTGLNDCEARSVNKFAFHVNAALTAINLAKAAHWIHTDKPERGPFSMSNVKTMYFNELLLNRFLEEFAINPYIPKNKEKLVRIRSFGCIAA